eukprot:PhM_4_TR7721/c0_g1_i1/m.26154/K12867/SYF1, XAB2; pre-mRNA-splicing factor SYF1
MSRSLLTVTDPSSLREWVHIIAVAGRTSTFDDKVALYGDALVHHPNSYKIWHGLLGLRADAVRSSVAQLSPTEDVHTLLELAVADFERCLSHHLHAMPSLWLLYAATLSSAGRLTATRQVFDRALQALPLTQHALVWKAYVSFAKDPRMPAASSLSILRRYLLFRPQDVEVLVEALSGHGMHLEAFKLLQSTEAPCERVLAYLLEHPVPHDDAVLRLIQDAVEAVTSSNLTDVILTAVVHFLRCGEHNTARDYLELGLERCAQPEAFAELFGAYAALEEEVAMSSDLDEHSLGRFARLLSRRDELENAVALRHAPQSVRLWLERAAHVGHDPEQVERTFVEALRVVAPNDCPPGTNPASLWTNFARWYESSRNDFNSAVDVFERALEVFDSTDVDQHAYLWCSYAEMYLRRNDVRGAISLLRRATATNIENPRAVRLGSLTARQKLWTSTRVWNLYVDLCESSGNVDATVMAYERMLQLRVGSAVQVLNYAEFLLSVPGRRDEAFTVFGRGVERFPRDSLLWHAYLQAYTRAMTGALWVESVRDLFEQCLAMVPLDAEDAHVLGIMEMYIRYEEQYGLAGDVLAQHERLFAIVSSGGEGVSTERRLEVLKSYLIAARRFNGPSGCRRILETVLKQQQQQPLFLATVCLWFAFLEVSLSEIERARSILTHGAMVCVGPPGGACDNRLGYWKAWKAFESAHGDVDTHREMQRVWRCVRGESGSGGGSTNAHAAPKQQQKRVRDD